MFFCSGTNPDKACTDIQAVSYNGPGAFTYGVEGREGGPWASRYLHMPSSESGLTIGRGYDMKTKSETKIINDLVDVGVSKENAAKIAKAAGKKGGSAAAVIGQQSLGDFSITPEQQNKLFKKSYDEETKEVIRICTKKDVVATYGATDWDKLDPAIKDILVDLKFRGDYSPAVRKDLQKKIVDNDLQGFRDAVAAIKKVPQDRMDGRLAYLDAALEEQKKTKVLAPTLAGSGVPKAGPASSTPVFGAPPPLRSGGAVVNKNPI